MPSLQSRLAHAEQAADRLPVPLDTLDPAPPLDRMERLWWSFLSRTHLPDHAHDAFGAAPPPPSTADAEAYDIVASVCRHRGLDVEAVLDWGGALCEILARGGAFGEIPPLPAYTRPGQVNTFATVGLAAHFAAFPLVHRTLLREGGDRRHAEAWRVEDPVAVLVYRYVVGLEMLGAYEHVLRVEKEVDA